MKKRLFTLITMVLIVLGCAACDIFTTSPDNKEPSEELISKDDTPMKLWYDEEAPKIKEGNGYGWMLSWGDQNTNDDGWTDWSLPIGNGYFGVNVFGRTETERLQITDKTLSNPWQVPSGDYPQMGGLNNFSETYIDFNHVNDNVSNYQRYLDIEKAISGVSYDYNGVTYTREYFTSYPDKALVIYLDADRDGKLNFTLRPTVPFEKEYALNPGDGFGKSGQVESSVDEYGVGCIELTGKMNYYGIDFMAQYRVYTEGGNITASKVTELKNENQNGGTHSQIGDGTIEVSGATKACIIVTLGTDYELGEGVFAGGQFDSQKKSTMYTTIEDTREKVEGYLEEIEDLIIDASLDEMYEILRDRHVEDYTELYDRVDFSLEFDSADLKLTTDMLLKKYQVGSSSNKTSKYLEALLFQYGRYLLIASSRPGTLPAHLQGAWNCYDIPPWSSGYWHNINVQMNYWHAFTTNLAETFDSYVELNQAYMPYAEQLATSEVTKFNPDMLDKDGGNGWTVGVSGNAFFINSDRSPGNMGFTTQLFWDYYRYTKDEKVLEKILPVLTNAARYITKSVKMDQEGNYLVDYCDSPEQYVGGVWYHTKGTTYAQSLSYLNNYYALQGAIALGVDVNNPDVLKSKEYSILKTIKGQLNSYDPINVGLSGQVKEFREEDYYGDLGDPSHRHISQLVGLYPGNLINSTTPAWLDAAKVTLEGRSGFSDNYGWVFSHKMSLYSRLKDSLNAYDQYKKLISNCITTNLWSVYEEIYQAESNFGATAGVAEMLLQSHEGYIEPLAALPNIWNSGSYVGLVAEGNFEVSAAWENNLATQFDIKSNNGGIVKVSYPSITESTVVDMFGNEVEYEVVGNNLISFETEEGMTYVITDFKKQEKVSSPINLTFTRDYQGTMNFTWDCASGTKYNIYKAVENDPEYTLIDTTTSNQFTYTPSADEINKRTTFAVTAVNKNGVESQRTLCYYNPTEFYGTISNVKWNVTTSGGIEFLVTANEFASKYRLYEKVSGANDFTLVTESSSNILSSPKYNRSSEYAVQTVSKYSNFESGLFVVEKNSNILANKKFIPTTAAANDIYSATYGYNGLTDGVFGEHDGRFSSKTQNNVIVDATVDLGQKYIVNELRIYDYKANPSFAGANLKVEAYVNNAWKTVVNLSNNSDISKHRSSVNGTNFYSYLSFNLGGVEATKVRVYINGSAGESISFYEVEIMGYSELPGSAAVTNVFSGKRFEPTTDALSAVFPAWDSTVDFGYDNLTDGSYSDTTGRFSTIVTDGTASSLMNGTINLGKNYTLNQLYLYDYTGEGSETGAFAGNDLKVEVYTNNQWQTVCNLTSNAQIVAKRDSSGAIKIDMGEVIASKVRISSTGAVAGKSISYYEFECYGKAA